MKKIFFFLVAALCSMSMWAISDGWYKVTDQEADYGLNLAGHSKTIQNINFDFEGGTLTFRDAFKPTESRYRRYFIEFWENGHGYSMWKHYYGISFLANLNTPYCDYVYNNCGQNKYAGLDAKLSVNQNAKGGERTEFGLSNLVDSLYARGLQSTRVVVWGETLDESGKAKTYEQLYADWYLPVPSSQADTTYMGLKHRNYANLYLPFARPRMSYSFTGRYGDDITFKTNVRAFRNVKLAIMMREDTNKPWRIFKRLTGLTSSECRQGRRETVTVNWNQTGVHKCQFCLVAIRPSGSPSAGDTIWDSPTQLIDVRYPCTIDGHTDYCRVGEQIVLATNAPCLDFSIDCKEPVKLLGSNGNYSIMMPSCPVTITSSTRMYKTTFLDYNGNVIKEEEVECGSTPNPPAAPSQAGYNFTKWSPSVSNAVTKDMVYQALFDPFASFGTYQLELKNHVSANSSLPHYDSETVITPGDEFDLQLKVKAGASVFVGLQVSSDGAPNWEDSYSYNVTASEAAAGKTITRHITIYNPDNYVRYRAWRFKLVSNGEVRYTNAIKMLMLYPTSIQASLPIVLDDGPYFNNLHLNANENYRLLLPKTNNSFNIFAADSQVGLDCLEGNSGSGWTSLENIEGATAETSTKIRFYNTGRPMDIQIRQKSYNVYFEVIGAPNIGYGNNVIEKQQVLCGQGAVAPNDPIDPITPDDPFVEWSQPFDNITDDTWITALFDSYIPDPVFTVTFKDLMGNTLGVEQVSQGETAPEPTNIPDIDGYVFVGWLGGNLYDVQQDLTLTTKYLPLEDYLSSVENPQAAPRVVKSIRNGQIIIIRGDKVYDIWGRLIK